MKKNYLYIALFLLFIKNIAFGQYTAAQIKTVDSVLTVLHQQGAFSGSVLIAEKGKVLYKKALGIENIEKNTPLSTNAAFNLASVSKQFVAMMIMMLKDNGQLQYDDKVQKYLPELPYPTLTIRHLLTHTSGLPEFFDLTLAHNNTLDTLTNEKMLQLLSSLKPPLVFEAGEKWAYSNTGYVILASLVEKIAKQPINLFFKEHIAQPLNMTNSFFYALKMPDAPTQKRVLGYQRENGVHIPNDLTRIDGVFGDGNMYSSVEDLFKWEQALYSSKLVKKETWREAISPVKLNDGTTYNYGFGWFLEDNGNIMRHTGSWAGFRNLLWRNTETKQSFIILTNNTDPSVRNFVKEILEGKTPQLPQYQLIINADVIDGTGTTAKKIAVRLKKDKIWEMGNLQPFVGETVIDAAGKVLAPGFIDSHSHHFDGLEKRPEATAAVNQGITTIIIGQDGHSIPIDTILQFFQRKPVAVNVATYTGHSSLRVKTMGFRGLFRTSKPDEVQAMKGILKEEMQKGSLGLCTGLEYESAFFSNRHEVLELAKVAAEYNGRYMSHIRSEDINLNEAIDEIIEIGRKTKMPVQISHIKIAKRGQWGSSNSLLAQLQAARTEGVNISADCYPYDFWNATLRVLFPNRDYTNLESAELAVTELCDPEKSIVTRFAPNKAYARKTLSEIAAMRHETPAQTLMYLIAEAEVFEDKNPDFDEGIEGIMGKSMDEPDVENFLQWAHTNICSDGAWRGHPRGHGAFTRVLGVYVREKNIMPLESAIYKMTGLTAEHLGLKNRGIIKQGNYADLVLFDPKTVKDNASVQNPTALSTGIEQVWVNGKIVYKNQSSTGQFSGVFIKRE